MNSDQLRQFKTIAECGNLTRAAEQLYITQPALSIALTKLEDELGKLLFIRRGRQLELTENGKKLLEYATTVIDTIDAATAYFRVPDSQSEIRIYRIGGIAASLLLAGCYDLPNYHLKLNLVHNYETPNVVGQAVAAFIIADDRYMNTAVYKGVEKVFLYRQQLLLAVREDDPLAEREQIDVSELDKITLVGRSTSKGFNDWLDDIQTDNHCIINEEIHCDYSFFVTESKHVPWPYLMNSFGLGKARQQPYFKGRKVIPVTGAYTQRDIYLWYDSRIRRILQPHINLIKGNAEAILRMDEESWDQA